MGQDYSYTQPSSSDEFDMTCLLQAEADLYADEGSAVGHVTRVTGGARGHVNGVTGVFGVAKFFVVFLK
uniref:Uncharacterized protein n=1 Tax=Brassica campestris TaxID=3711 RepID=M4FBL0_BRACM